MYVYLLKVDKNRYADLGPEHTYFDLIFVFKIAQ